MTRAGPLLLVALVTSTCDSPRAPMSRPIDAAPPAVRPADARRASGPGPVGNLESFTHGMVRIPEGEYLTGCVAAVDRNCHLPLRKKFLPEFYIDRLEATVDDYQRCVAAGKCIAPAATELCPAERLNWGRADRALHPINCVTPEQAARYCAYRRMHLPTNFQWEKAARGTDGRVYPWGDQPATCDLAIIATSERDESEGCGTQGTWPVGSRPEGASPYGVLDLAGNVADYMTMSDDPVDPSTVHDRIWTRNPEGKGVPIDAYGGTFRYTESAGFWTWARTPSMGFPGDGVRCAYQPSARW